MRKVVEDVSGLFRFATSEERRFFGKAPSLANIEKEINNFELFSREGKRGSGRIGMGEACLNNDEVVGYHSFIVMENARATPYEREFMDMGSGLNYVFSKKLFVHPEYRGKGIGSRLMGNALDLSKELGKHHIIDVEVDNYSMVNILNQHEFQNDFAWDNRKGVKMLRFYHD